VRAAALCESGPDPRHICSVPQRFMAFPPSAQCRIISMPQSRVFRACHRVLGCAKRTSIIASFAVIEPLVRSWLSTGLSTRVCSPRSGLRQLAIDTKIFGSRPRSELRSPGALRTEPNEELLVLLHALAVDKALRKADLADIPLKALLREASLVCPEQEKATFGFEV
jgi:hypothetical protein